MIWQHNRWPNLQRLAGSFIKCSRAIVLWVIYSYLHKKAIHDNESEQCLDDSPRWQSFLNLIFLMIGLYIVAFAISTIYSLYITSNDLMQDLFKYREDNPKILFNYEETHKNRIDVILEQKSKQNKTAAKDAVKK